MRRAILRTDRLDVRELSRQLDSWLFDGEAQSCTKATLAHRRNFVDRLRWFVQQRE
jgi:hypothetical protein